MEVPISSPQLRGLGINASDLACYTVRRVMDTMYMYEEPSGC